jgi:hypothetical protein
MRAILGLPLLVLMGLAQAPTTNPPQPPLDPNESAVVQQLEVVVVGRRPGPALWRIRRGEAEVVVLGGLSPLPHSLHWDTQRVERAMDGATVVILPPNGRLGPLDLVYMLFHAGELRLSGGRRLWDELTPDQRRRFDTLRLQAKTEPKRYEKLKPAVAAFTLLADFEKAAGLSSAKPGSTVKTLAEAHHVPTRTSGGIPVGQLFRTIVAMDPAAERACTDAALNEADRAASTARPLAEAWAVGDLKTVRADYLPTGFDRCLAGSGLQGFIEKQILDSTASIDAALAKGGKTVAVVDMRLLLSADGVLDRLKAEGAEITVPPP